MYIQQLSKQHFKLEPEAPDTSTDTMAYKIQEAKTDEEILNCWETISGLRTQIKKEDYLSQVRQQQSEGYHMMYIVNPEVGQVQSVIGFREFTMLYCGRAIYIEDLATLPAGRGKGFAGALIDWVINYTVENGYKHLSVDSHHIRHNAHRLYLNKGFDIKCHHFQYAPLDEKFHSV